MYKKFLALLVALVLVFASSPALAADQKPVDHSKAIVISSSEDPVIFSGTITVTCEGGIFTIGFITLDFKKGFMNPSALPVTLNVEIYAQDNKVYIEGDPGTQDFIKQVHIKVSRYVGPLYSKSLGGNTLVDVKAQQLLLEHFSRYALR